MMNIAIDNNLQQYAVIVGEGVSKGARSPLLWNRAFESLDIKAKMFPLDVNSNASIDEILNELFQDSRFIGGAVAAPLKLEVSRYVSSKKSNTHSPITPVNCFFRSPDGSIDAVNTDILAAIESIETVRPVNDFKKIAVIGSGAIAQGLCKELKLTTNAGVSVFRRSPNFDEFFRLLGCLIYNISALPNDIAEFDLIVNCTPIGKDGHSEETPVSEEALLCIKKDCFIFDVNYINGPSKFLRLVDKRGIRTKDGLRMNLVQAAISFRLATGSRYDSEQILKLMGER